ncbi:MAG: hypothetical protein M0011_13330 [Elusimicrobia bacterium]|nr:hypothetical protein [Elusimicrobiota bacterium]
MLREGTEVARKIIDFYSCRGIECSVVDEHSSLLVMLCSDGRTHEFRCGRRIFSGGGSWRRVWRELERETLALKGQRKGEEE